MAKVAARDKVQHSDVREVRSAVAAAFLNSASEAAIILAVRSLFELYLMYQPTIDTKRNMPEQDAEALAAGLLRLAERDAPNSLFVHLHLDAPLFTSGR
ncbi:MAG: hypothetical protein C0600_12510 [Ignavibacteria bacterium]|nr:MAG: hypothetical protein C0600_12510 [Ignavibacteria bacterium]